MAGEVAKTINDYTDDELAELTNEELEALRGDAHAGADDDAEAQRLIDEQAEADRLAQEEADKNKLDPEALARLAAEGDGGKGHMVPHSRFQEVNEERRVLLEEVLRLRAGPAAVEKKVDAPPPYDFKAARREYQRLLLDDPDKAMDKLDEIEEAREAQTSARIADAVNKTKEEVTRQFEGARTTDHAATAASQLYEKYPFLDHESDAASSAAIYAVIGRRDALIKEGKNPVEAMRMAAIEIGDQFSAFLKPADTTAANANGETPAQKAARIAEERRVAALTKNAKTSVGQPPPAGGIGNRAGADKLDITKMSDEQLAKLSPEELAAARGDFRVPADA